MADDLLKPQSATDSLPPEPEPVPVVPPPATAEPVVPPAPTLDPLPAPTPVETPVPAPSVAAPSVSSTASPDALVESILETKSPDSMVVPPVQEKSQHHSSLPKKSSKGPLIALIALLLLVLPTSVYFISLKNQQIADVRSRAWGTGYSNCSGATDDNPRGTCPAGYVCDCMDGEMCTEKQCMPEDDKKASCERQGRSYCENMNGGAMTCCYPGYVCWEGGAGCILAGDDDNGDDDDDTTNPTPTPTTGTAPVCQNIKIYKDGTQVTDLTTLRAGDEVVLAVKGNLSPTKAHFRVNGGAWTETTTKNASNEFTLNYTIADGVTDFVIEGEVFTNGAWH
jgi:hypothetical protein